MGKENESKMLEEELFILTEMADKIYEYLKTRKDEVIPSKIAMRECPEIYKAYLLNEYGEEEKAAFIVKRVKERMKEEDGKRNGR